MDKNKKENSFFDKISNSLKTQIGFLNEEIKSEISESKNDLIKIDVKDKDTYIFSNILEDNNFKLKTIVDIDILLYGGFKPVDKEFMSEQEFLFFKDNLIIPVLTRNGKKALIINSLFKKIYIKILKKYCDGEIFLIEKENSIKVLYAFLFETLKLESQNTITFINELLTKAEIMNASDIHLSWMKDYVLIRFRVDGNFQEENWEVIDKKLGENIRIALINNANEDEFSVKPIDGKFTLKILDKVKEFRLSVGNSVLGHSIVIRNLPSLNKDLTLEKLGYTKKALDIIKNIEQNQYGICLVTGPTGSGKTTTLYTHIKNIYQENPKIIKTIEDPVEIFFEGIDQYQVNTKGDEEYQMTYLKAIKMFLRQDPDIILLGEIRDNKVATEAFRAALTGHFVYSTLHTNNVESSILRLMDLGIGKDKIEDTLVGVINQRLIPKLCDCKIQLKSGLFKRNIHGCKKCEFSKIKGYLGRTVIAEIAELDLKIDNFKKENFINYYSKKENLEELLNNGVIDKPTFNKYIDL